MSKRGNGDYLREQNLALAGSGVISEWARKAAKTRRARAAQLSLPFHEAPAPEAEEEEAPQKHDKGAT